MGVERYPDLFEGRSGGVPTHGAPGGGGLETTRPIKNIPSYLGCRTENPLKLSWKGPVKHLVARSRLAAPPRP